MAEKIILCISGIIKTVSSEYEILGVGEMKNPENAMIITDKRVILLTVPMSGSGKVIGGFSFTEIQWLFLQKEIRRKLDDLFSTKSLQDILKTTPNFSINLSEIGKVKIRSFWGRGITIITKSGRKYGYTIRNKEDITNLKKVFHNYP